MTLNQLFAQEELLKLIADETEETTEEDDMEETEEDDMEETGEDEETEAAA